MQVPESLIMNMLKMRKYNNKWFRFKSVPSIALARVLTGRFGRTIYAHIVCGLRNHKSEKNDIDQLARYG